MCSIAVFAIIPTWKCLRPRRCAARCVIGWLPRRLVAVGNRVYLAPGATDMRKSFDGLAAATRQVIRKDPLSGHVFVFCNRRRHLIKVLLWDEDDSLLSRLAEGAANRSEAEQKLEVVPVGAEGLAMMERGYRTAKLRVKSPYLHEDIRQIEVVRKGIGEDFALGVDANQGWLVSIVDRIPAWDLERATEFAAACADNGISWLEEPLDWHDYDGLAELRRRMTTLKIAGCELNAGWQEAKIFLEKGSFDIYQPDATFGGGISDAVRVMQACRERGLTFAPHTWTNGIGLIVNLHVYAAGDRAHPLEYPFEPPGWVPEVRDGLLAEPILADGAGTIAVPEAPGLGIVLDEDKLARYGEKFFDITTRGIAVKTIREKGLFTALRLARRKRRR